MPQNEIAEPQHKAPVLPGILIEDRGDLVRTDRLARVGEHLAMQSSLDRARLVRRRQLGTGKIGFEKLVGDAETAARIAIKVASQLASAARKSHPGDGLEPAPPTDAGMSVEIRSPAGPSTRTWRPFSSVAVAMESVYRASSGCSLR